MSLIPPVVSAALRQRAVSALRWAPLRGLARAVLGVMIAALSLLVVAWLALHWMILPHIQQWRAPIEARASQALGLTVRIGHIEVRSGGWVPAFELRDVVLLDAGAARRTAAAARRRGAVAALAARAASCASRSC